MDDKKYNLLYVLNRLVNDENTDVNATLARYFITNFYKAKDFNIYDIATECDVSRSSIRRFAKELGYVNFWTLKRLMIEEGKQPIRIPNDKYREDLTNNIDSIIGELNERMNTDQVAVICDWIRSAENFYIVCSGGTLSAIKDFQVNLASKGKLSQIIYNEESIKYLSKNIGKKDKILVISISGVAANRFLDMFDNDIAPKMLITANRVTNFDNFQKVYYMSHLDHSKDPVFYRKYGLSYLLDILANCY